MFIYTIEDFQRVIGELDGTPIIGNYRSDDSDPATFGRPFGITLEWGAGELVQLDTDANGRIVHLVLPFSDRASLSGAEYGALREFVTSGIVERLVPICVRHNASAPLPMNAKHARVTNELRKAMYRAASRMRLEHIPEGAGDLLDMFPAAVAARRLSEFAVVLDAAPEAVHDFVVEVMGNTVELIERERSAAA